MTQARLVRHEAAIRRLARIGDITRRGRSAERLDADRGRRGDVLPAARQPDRPSVEAARLQKEIAKVTEEIARLHKKLSNEKFVANAPEEIVAAEREKLAEFEEAQSRLQLALSRVREAG